MAESQETMSISTHSIVSVLELKKQNSDEKETFIASLSKQEIKTEASEANSTEQEEPQISELKESEVEKTDVEKIESEASRTQFRDGCTIIETSNKKLVEVFDPKG